MEEKIYFKDNKIIVTSSRIIIRDTTFALRNISSVRKYLIEPKRTYEVALIMIGIISIIVGIYRTTYRGCIIMGIVLGIIGVIILIGNKREYSVQLGTNAGEKNIFKSANGDYIHKIVDAINNAIIEYR